MPMFPTVGNHDIEVTGSGNCVTYYYYGNPATQIGCLVANTYNYRHYFPGYRQGTSENQSKQYYRTRYGPAVIWTLTSYPMGGYCSETNLNYQPESEGGTGQYDWLESTLQDFASFGQPPRWKIVQMHAPLYSPDSCRNQIDGQTYLPPLFEEYGVDIVLSGHEHYYARKTVNGIPYVITGGGGANLSLNPDSECWSNPQCLGFDMVQSRYHFLFFNVVGDIMSVDVRFKDNSLLETFTVDRRPKADFDATGASDTVSFTDKSTGHVVGCQWDFDGDGVIDSTERNPSHTYEQDGSYEVTLKAISYWGTSSRYTRTIKVPAGADSHSSPTCTRNWTDPMSVPGWFGSNNQGSGAAAADVDGNGKSDLVLFHIDHGSHGNCGYYRVGWDMASDGTISKWTDPMKVPGWFGSNNQGGGAAVADVDGNGKPDLLIFHIDHGSDANYGYYRVGWDLGSDGSVSSWTDPVKVPGWFGTVNGGGGLAAADMDGNGTTDLIVFHVDHPDGDNKGYYRIGWDMGSDGTISSWTDPMHVGDYFSQKKGSQGGGIAVMDIDNNGTPDLVALDIEHDVGKNTGLYLVGLNPDKEGKVDSWKNLHPIPHWWGSASQYGGATLADIDSDGFPEMIAFHIDHTSDGNSGYYRVGWDVQADGDTSAICTDTTEPKPSHR